MSVRRIPWPSIVLILGSYDPETKDVLYEVKEEIAKLSTYYDEVYLLPLLLEDVEVFSAVHDNRKCIAIVEKYGGSLYTVALIDQQTSEVLLVEDLRGSSFEDARSELEDLGVSQLLQLPLIRKFETLAEATWLVIVVRHKEETRCGEIVELVMLVERGLNLSGVRFLAREGLNLSSMVEEMLRAYSIYWERYEDDNRLLDIVRKLVQYGVERNMPRFLPT